MTNPEFDQGGGEDPSTIGFYEDAARLGDIIPGLIEARVGRDEIRSILQGFTDESPYRGSVLKIESPIHYIDWSYGSAVSDGNAEVEVAMGKFQGVFIGYQLAPCVHAITGEQSLSLSTVLDAAITDPDIDQIRVFVVTPINIANIEFAN